MITSRARVKKVNVAITAAMRAAQGTRTGPEDFSRAYRRRSQARSLLARQGRRTSNRRRRFERWKRWRTPEAARPGRNVVAGAGSGYRSVAWRPRQDESWPGVRAGELNERVPLRKPPAPEVY